MVDLPFVTASPGPLQRTIPSYLYTEYNDDPNLQALVDAYNNIAQQYVDLFNQIGLPVYTGPMIVGALLDWVAEGLYGLKRPVLPSGLVHVLGSFNTYAFNSIPFNQRRVLAPTDIFAADDDTLKRVITWHFFKGDGKGFNIRWLKRRIMRFLNGANGASYNIDETYRVSVTFGVGNQVNIRILNGTRSITGGAIFNAMGFNTSPFDALRSNRINYPAITEAEILKSAIDSGTLELPFQFQYVVSI